jgi:hypothetical protein
MSILRDTERIDPRRAGDTYTALPARFAGERVEKGVGLQVLVLA